jgi:hypothetical protein
MRRAMGNDLIRSFMSGTAWLAGLVAAGLALLTYLSPSSNPVDVILTLRQTVQVQVEYQSVLADLGKLGALDVALLNEALQKYVRE